MTVAPHLNAIKISNFRSIVEPLEIPLQNKMTFLVGQNNSGKTGILGFLGLLLNNGGIILEDRSSLSSKATEATFVISTNAIRKLASTLSYLPRAILADCTEEFTITHSFEPNSVNRLKDDLFRVLNVNYFSSSGQFSGHFQEDFKQSNSAQNANVHHFLSQLWPRLSIPQTVYVSSHRMILHGVATMPQFGQLEFPGNTIPLHTIVAELATLGRPFGSPSQREEARVKLANICSFIAYCIEVNKVEIQIPDGKQTIYISIDGNEQPISNLGSGIEQLIVIGMGSFIFSNHIVLIDEPEIHFHPRTQKRMMKYLHENADAKFVIATHSAAILDSIQGDIVQIWQENQQCLGRTVQNNFDRHGAVKNLGHSPSELVLANFVVWVEGPSDRVYFNHWIEKLDSTLVEGTDYAIIFYGGSILARHAFDEDDAADGDDLVKALSISRNFAVYMDSDKTSEAAKLKPRVERVTKESETSKGMPWISAGREIENYIPQAVLNQMKGFDLNPTKQFGRVVKSEKFDKVKFAEQAVKLWGDEWPYDLKEKCAELVQRIESAR